MPAGKLKRCPSLILKVDCSSKYPDARLRVGWVLRYSPCAGEYTSIKDSTYKKQMLYLYYNTPQILLFYPDLNYSKVEYMKSEGEIIDCDSGINLEHFTGKVMIEDAFIPEKFTTNNDTSDKAVKPVNEVPKVTKPPSPTTSTPTTTITTTTAVKGEKTTAAAMRRREAEGGKGEDVTTQNPNKTTEIDQHNIATVWKDGSYIFILSIIPTARVEYSATMTVRMLGNYGYISAVEWPLLIFYGVMGLVYIVFGLVWLVMLACNWRDLLRVQYWIGGVIVLGMLEKAVFYAEYQSITNYGVSVTVRMLGNYGYISAVEWPLLIFYGVMGLVYIVFGLVWLVMLACNWRDLLRVQYWIGGVIVLGMLEKAVFYAEYQSITNYGVSVTSGAIIFAELVSCLKRALARMLVIIVSLELGFGIVKPRLGPTFHKVLFVGGLYFILASIEGCMRSLKPKGDQSKDMMLSAIPLTIVDASICLWIFSCLRQTIRQLRLRRNIVKLSMYIHFTYTLIFAVLASIMFKIWSIVQIKMKQCITDWWELWIDEAFWYMLFSIILMVIMFLWRPSTNNQRYAFSPLLDAADDEDEIETVLNDAFDGMKMRKNIQANGSPQHKEQNTIEDDLKWVEENIPLSVAEKALPSLLDSDEEVMTAKYEMSKMQ